MSLQKSLLLHSSLVFTHITTFGPLQNDMAKEKVTTNMLYLFVV